MEFNINDYVWVRLTDKGREIHRQYWEPFSGGKYTPPKATANGWSKFQMHYVISTFGRDIGIGFCVPFETTIYIGNDLPPEIEART